ncbi:MAG TPA: UvrD-helicase domain-containing protein [Kofleriaceae bacterium]|nr:UvrD-helicase domain-containing protein [Kofleriaceae bacterium]
MGVDVGALNPPQREAVTHTGGPLLVLAGAGSGKTRVITYRIAHLIERGVHPRHIAALTFTNKAAAEMRARVARLVGNRSIANELTMGTFHSLGLEMLQKERAAFGFPRGFVIYDTADQIGVLRELLRHSAVDGDRRFDVKSILTRISLAKNAFIAPEDFRPNESDPYDLVTAEIYPRYQAALRAFAAVDFDDLITEPVRLLARSDEVRVNWSSRFRHVLVDEYQDTNRAQLLLVKALSSTHGNICVVGDDDQSIYSWRGADPGNILHFERDFPGAKAVVLDQNYRSTPTILAAANAVIGHNTDRRGKVLWSANKDGPRIAHVTADDPETEARFVAEEIERLTGAGRRLRDIAVLYRSNIQTKELEESLRTRKLNYVMVGGQQFYERKEVKDVIAYLRVALSDRDEISLRRIINYPARGVGATTLDRLSLEAQAARIPLWRAVVNGSRGEGGQRAQQADALASLVAIIDKLRVALEASGAEAAVRGLLEDIDLHGDLRAASPSLTAAQRRIDNVESLVRQLTEREKKTPGPAALLDYLRKLSLQSDSDESAADPGDKVLLTTLHGAKGLEFPVVFLVGAEEELLPHARSLMPQANDVSDPDHVSDVSEERRLAYVGITRAEEMLYVSRCARRRRHGKDIPRTPSRFLLEIPPELCEMRDVAAEQRKPVEAAELSAFFQKFVDNDP